MMSDYDNVIKGLHDIGGFITGRIGIEQARNFLRTIDDAIELLEKQNEQENKLLKGRYYSDVFNIGYKAGKNSIIKCLNCRYWHRLKSYPGLGRCGLSFGIIREGNWFCGNGRKRDDNDG